MRGIKQKKGLTPVIAVILLLMMTVAAAGAAFFWFIRVQGELQGGEEQYAQSLAENVASKVSVQLVDYKRYSGYNGSEVHAANDMFGNLTLILRNDGNTKITMNNASTAPSLNWILQNNQQKIICNEDWADQPSMCIVGCGSGEFAVKETKKVVLNLSDTCDIGNETTYPNDTAFYFKLDFAGKTGTGGSFKK